MRQTSAWRRDREAGFSVIELLVVTAAIAVIASIFLVGIRQATGAFALRQAASLTMSELRKAQALAMAEGSGVSYTVEFVYGAPGGLNIYRVGTLVKSIAPPNWPSTVTFDNTQTTFPACAGVGNPTNTCVSFQPLGYANAGGTAALNGGVGTQRTWLVTVAAATGKVSVTQQ